MNRRSRPFIVGPYVLVNKPDDQHDLSAHIFSPHSGQMLAVWHHNLRSAIRVDVGFQDTLLHQIIEHAGSDVLGDPSHAFMKPIV